MASSAKAGVISSLDQETLLEVAVDADIEVELVCAVGEFVDHGQTVILVHGDVDGQGLADILLAAVDISEERTIAQDPEFAIRIIVDTAIRALSPAVNDPTTAVHAIDALEEIMRELGARELDTTLLTDTHGSPRVWWPSPDWSDLLELGLDEIRAYGADSVQVCRRLRAALEDLRATTPELRHPLLDEHLRRLEASVRLAFPSGSPDLEPALGTDRLGLGRARRPAR